MTAPRVKHQPDRQLSGPWETDRNPTRTGTRSRFGEPQEYCRAYFKNAVGDWSRQDLMCSSVDMILTAIEIYEPGMFEMFPWFQGVEVVKFRGTNFIVERRA